ncbi:MAG: hypothetical protein J6M62_07255 [Selenomonadaceae bacterium]|nr:hypothetical protein [Selenomonadaceae bacterium]
MASKAQSRASAKYDKEHTKGIYLKLNKEKDELILEYLHNDVNNVQGLIKELLLRHIHGLDNYYSIYED